MRINQQKTILHQSERILQILIYIKLVLCRWFICKRKRI